MKKVTIKKKWFYGAGSVYGWSKVAGLHRFGVGIAMDILKTEPTIRVDIDKGKYTLDCLKALNFISWFRSVKVIRKKRIGIISKSLLKPIINGK